MATVTAISIQKKWGNSKKIGIRELSHIELNSLMPKPPHIRRCDGVRVEMIIFGICSFCNIFAKSEYKY